MKPRETLSRSVLKIVSHRVGSLVITFSVLSAMGVPPMEGITYTLAVNGVKTIAAISYERVWVRFGWGYHHEMKGKNAKRHGRNQRVITKEMI